MTVPNDKLDWMARTQLESRGIHDPRVLEAVRAVDRAAFVPAEFTEFAYEDRPLGIGEGQTISQPYMVALMTQSLALSGRERVLEIGTGSGYQTALLARLAAEVYTVEYYASLQERAKAVLDGLGFTNIHYRVGNGRRGWPEEAPFDRILCAAAAENVPYVWLEQLADPGMLLVPIGPRESQVLVQVSKRGGRTLRSEFCPCRFVPLMDEEGGAGP